MRQTDSNTILHYIRDLYAAEDAQLQHIRERLEADGDAIHIAPEEGRLLQLLMRMNRVTRVLEIGTLGGYSAVWMARALPEGGQLITLERDAARAKRAAELLAETDCASKIQLKTGCALETLQQMREEMHAAEHPAALQLDMVFIDASKIDYPAFLEAVDPLLKQGGLLVADNTLLHGAVHLSADGTSELPRRIRPTTLRHMQKFNATMADTSRYDAVLLPTVEGLTIAIKQ